MFVKTEQMFTGDGGLETLWVEMQMIFNIFSFPSNQVTTLPGADNGRGGGHKQLWMIM